jgi:hypothetical protein
MLQYVEDWREKKFDLLYRPCQLVSDLKCQNSASARASAPPIAGQPQAQRFTVKDRKRAMTPDQVEKASWTNTHQISSQKAFRK